MNRRTISGVLALFLISACANSDHGAQQSTDKRVVSESQQAPIADMARNKEPLADASQESVSEISRLPVSEKREIVLAQNSILKAAPKSKPAAARKPEQPATTAIPNKSYDEARWDPIHFKPAIDSASNEQCLGCHREILERNVLDKSPAGVRANETLAWYQTLGVYEGNQQTFHQRHLTGPLATKLMDLECNFCHQGNDPREEAPATSASNQSDTGYALRKMVDPETTCLRCHGDMNWINMGIPGSWAENGKLFQDNCMTCHAAIRTNRHQVTYLKADAIEEAGKEDSDSCYGCHGGRKWYRTEYPYPRHPWPGGGDAVPDWAKERQTESEPRFQLSNK